MPQYADKLPVTGCLYTKAHKLINREKRRLKVPLFSYHEGGNEI